MMRSSNSKIVSVILSLIWVLILATQATAGLAEASMPPWRSWLKFDTPSLQAVQILRYKTPESQELVLVKEYGICNAKGCFKSNPEFLNTNLQLKCHDNLCLLSHSYPGRIQAIAQIDDRIYQSNDIQFRGDIDYNRDDAKYGYDNREIKIIDNKLKVTPNSEFAAENVPIGILLVSCIFWWIPLSIVSIKLLAWGIYLKRKEKLDRIGIWQTLPIVVAANLFSYPSGCFSFPAFIYFTDPGDRIVAIVWLVLSILYIALTAIDFTSQKSGRLIITIFGTVCYWLLSILIFFITYIMTHFFPNLTDDGLSLPTVIILAELFIIGYEGIIVYNLKKDTFNFKSAIIGSAIANTASLVGIVICGSILAINKLSLHIP
jgi:hypothetical protein